MNTCSVCVVSTEYNVGGPVGSIPVKATRPVDVPKKSYHNEVDETTPCMYNIATIQRCMYVHVILFTVTQPDNMKQTHGASNNTRHGSSDQVAIIWYSYLASQAVVLYL